MSLSPFNLTYEVSSAAQTLEKVLGVSWELQKENPADPYIKLRACIDNNMVFQKRHSCFYCRTGIYPQFSNPNYRLEITSLSDLVYEKGIIILDSPSIYDYTHRNEIILLLQSVRDNDIYIHPGEFIAALSVKRVEVFMTKRIYQVEDAPYTFGSQKWIQKLKNKSKGERESTEYSSLDVKRYLDA